jgi:hypothetical protein
MIADSFIEPHLVAQTICSGQVSTDTLLALAPRLAWEGTAPGDIGLMEHLSAWCEKDSGRSHVITHTKPCVVAMGGLDLLPPAKGELRQRKKRGTTVCKALFACFGLVVFYMSYHTVSF